MPEALGPTNLVWLNSGQPAWFAESTNTHDGFAAAAAGPLTFYQAVLQTTVTGPGTISFWWADAHYVTLTFLIDGISKATWQQYYSSSWANPTFYLSSGVHVLTWNAANNDYPFFTGMGFLDQVTYTPGPAPAWITTQPASQTNAAGTNVTFSVGASGTQPMSYQWYFDGASISGATGSALALTNIQTNNIGNYSVEVTNGYGLAVSSNAVLEVTPSAPTITTQPGNAEVMVGGQAAFSGFRRWLQPDQLSMAVQWLRNSRRDQSFPDREQRSIYQRRQLCFGRQQRRWFGRQYQCNSIGLHHRRPGGGFEQFGNHLEHDECALASGDQHHPQWSFRRPKRGHLRQPALHFTSLDFHGQEFA